MPLPLKLNSFDRYMWADDSPKYPMSFFIRVLFSGQFDQSAFVAALEAALRRHPLLCARIAGQSDRDLEWVASPCLLPRLDCADENVPMRFSDGFRIDLREENGLRIWVRHGSGRGEIRFQFHHACCDGVAANQFIEDLLCIYDRQPAEALRSLDTAQLRYRNRFGATGLGRLFYKLVTLWGQVVGAPLFVLPRPAPLRIPPNGCDTYEHNSMAVPELLTWRFTPVQLSHLQAAAKQNYATLNDLMLRDYFLALQSWNESHGGEGVAVLRIMVPFDLRGREHRRLPAANVVGMANLDRHIGPSSHQEAKPLLDSIRRQTSFLKKFRLAAAFGSVVSVVGWFSGGLRQMLADDRCLATAVLSNLGEIFTDSPLRRADGRLRAGGLIIEAVDTAPPIRACSRIACTLSTYAGRLSLTMNYDRRVFQPCAAKQLLDCIVTQIERTAS